MQLSPPKSTLEMSEHSFELVELRNGVFRNDILTSHARLGPEGGFFIVKVKAVECKRVHKRFKDSEFQGCQDTTIDKEKRCLQAHH